MRWIKFCGAVLTTLSMTSLANAGLLNLGGCGAAKSCGCAPTHQPVCCKPVIVKPCHRTVHNYQRQCVGVKPLCSDKCAPTSCCAPAPAACAPAPAAAAPACCAPAPAAAAPACCAPAPKPACSAPAPAAAAPACCAPAPMAAAPACCAPAPKPACCAPAPAPAACAPAPSACAPAPAAATCAAPCAPAATACGPAKTCCVDPCKVAALIYESQTACYARQRRAAIHKLGDKYDCVCNPEIMAAFIYALNDADESVRTKAADEIGDQIRKHGCCSPDVVAALTCALADCHRGVRREAEQALKLCGYDVVAGDCCKTACNTGCNTGCAPAASNCGPSSAPAPAPMPATEGAPAPVPPATGLFKGRTLSTLLGMR